MTLEEHHRKLERMYHTAVPINEYFRPVLRISDGRAEWSMKVRRDFFHAAGAVHGAAYFKGLDDAAFFAVNSLVPDVFVLTVSFTIYMTGRISEGEMRATGQVTYRSKRLYLAESQLFDSDGREIGRGNGVFVPSNIPLAPEIGYV